MKAKDIKIELIKGKSRSKPHNNTCFVKVTHIPSNLSHCSMVVSSQDDARLTATGFLGQMVNVWEVS